MYDLLIDALSINSNKSGIYNYTINFLYYLLKNLEFKTNKKKKKFYYGCINITKNILLNLL